ncbi:hypothetical protein L4D76_20870 [Photobacterium sagamiensis]|uniref:hypothetical protein n=1 Tax=Photobacterium sagamiensis TaxID=2910241 RepID=UPI003D0A405E
MKLRNACLILSLALASSNATADIKSDIAAGLDIQHVITNATEQDMKFGSIISTIAKINPELLTTVVSTLVKTNPNQASEITVAAVSAAPQLEQQIVDAAIKQAPSQSANIIAALITAGHDPLTLTQAPVAGTATNTTPTIYKQLSTPMSVGNGGGGTGGIGTASPN